MLLGKGASKGAREWGRVRKKIRHPISSLYIDQEKIYGGFSLIFYAFPTHKPRLPLYNTSTNEPRKGGVYVTYYISGYRKYGAAICFLPHSDTYHTVQSVRAFRKVSISGRAEPCCLTNRLSNSPLTLPFLGFVISSQERLRFCMASNADIFVWLHPTRNPMKTRPLILCTTPTRNHLVIQLARKRLPRTDKLPYIYTNETARRARRRRAKSVVISIQHSALTIKHFLSALI